MGSKQNSVIARGIIFVYLGLFCIDNAIAGNVVLNSVLLILLAFFSRTILQGASRKTKAYAFTLSLFFSALYTLGHQMHKYDSLYYLLHEHVIENLAYFLGHLIAVYII